MKDQGRPVAGALDGVKVLELGQLIAGPFCGQMLADFGADVVKIEAPGAGDPIREWGKEKTGGKSLYWPVIGRNKKSVTLNLRVAEGQALARRLALESDILIENFRPGTLEKWGLGWEELSRLNPRLIMVRVTGYGQTGPYAERAGYGAIGEAMGGLRYVNGDPSTPPSRVGVAIGDTLTGLHAAYGALAALQARTRTGRGQLVDAAIYESVLNMMESLITDYDVAGFVRERTGSIFPGIAPSNIYPTACGRSVLIGANQDTVFRRLSQVMGQEALGTDPRFASHTARGQNQALLDRLIGEWTIQHTRESVLAMLDEAGIPAGQLYTAKEMLDDPQFASRNTIIRAPSDDLGQVAMQNVAPRLSETPGGVQHAGVKLGAFNREIFVGRLGLSEEQFAAYQEAGVI